MQRARWAALLLVAFAQTAIAKPPPYVTLSSVRPAELISTFNADASHARLIVMLSPT